MRFRFGALLVLALAAGVIAWLVLRDTGSSSSSGSNATAVSIDQIASLAASVNHPVFWLGPRDGYTYELTRNNKGSIFIRYLPQGVSVGAGKPYPTVATYPFPGAFAALQAVDKSGGSAQIKLAHGGIALPSEGYPQSVHAAYPGVDSQVEVFDPTPGNAAAAVSAGQLVAFGDLNASTPAPPSKPVAASAADLKSLAGSLGHPIYWVGPRKGYTYELLQSGGRVYIRYLPPGVAVGAKGLYLTAATYPFPGAFGAIQTLAKQKNETSVKLPGGGLALIDADHPRNIHLAYPGSAVQVELFDPSPARVRHIVGSGGVSAIG